MMITNRKSKLPDTPWHVGYALKEEDDPRRHKSRCIHLRENICKCGLSGCYLTHCAGSSHCKYYAENEAQWDNYLEEMKTAEDKAKESAEIRKALARQKKRDFVRAQLESCTYEKRYNFWSGMRECPFCWSRMKDLECQYCLAKFKVVKHFTDDQMRSAAEEGYFLIK